MNVLALDEAQGLTPLMVREWIAKAGYPSLACPNDPVCSSLGTHTHHHLDVRFDTHHVAIPDMPHETDDQICTMSDSLIMVARARLRTVQDILREINPRMRKGIPSHAARAAHRLAWVGQSSGSADGRKNLMIGLWDGGSFRRGGTYARHPEEWSFWPVDVNGNKVWWTTDAEGNML